MEPKIQEKVWEPKIESEIRKTWDESGIYDFTIKDSNYTIDTPPPYPSGRPWHIGAASHYAQIDMIARTARMSGKNVYFPIGIDRNGLPVELYTEKKHDIRMRETERGEFIQLCKNALDDLESEMIQIMKSLGISADFKNYYRTDSEEYRKFTQATFIDLWKQGTIYLATRPNNYDWVSGTTIADAEIVYDEIPTKLVYMKFIVQDTSKKIIIASVPPVVTITSISLFFNHFMIIFFIFSFSSLTIFLSTSLCFCSSIFFTKIDPDLSVSIVLVSVTVKSAILTCIIYLQDK